MRSTYLLAALAAGSVAQASSCFGRCQTEFMSLYSLSEASAKALCTTGKPSACRENDTESASDCRAAYSNPYECASGYLPTLGTEGLTQRPSSDIHLNQPTSKYFGCKPEFCLDVTSVPLTLYMIHHENWSAPQALYFWADEVGTHNSFSPKECHFKIGSQSV